MYFVSFNIWGEKFQTLILWSKIYVREYVQLQRTKNFEVKKEETHLNFIQELWQEKELF